MDKKLNAVVLTVAGALYNKEIVITIVAVAELCGKVWIIWLHGNASSPLPLSNDTFTRKKE